MAINSTRYFISSFLSRKETRLFVICTTTGWLLQLVCKKYIENHPEFFEEPTLILTVKDPSGKTERITNEIIKKTNETKIRRLIERLRGGGVLTKAGEFFLRMMLKRLIKLAAKKGVEIGVSIGTGAVLVATPRNALVKIVERSLPQTFMDLKNLKVIDGEGVYFTACKNDPSLKFMLEALLNSEIPYSEKQRIVAYAFQKLTESDALAFILCLIPILLLLAISSPSSYILLLQSLIQAIKEGKISKRIARILVRRLIKKGKMVDPELLDLVKA